MAPPSGEIPSGQMGHISTLYKNCCRTPILQMRSNAPSTALISRPDSMHASSGIVEQPVYKRFANALIECMRGLIVDDALKSEPHIGLVVDAATR
jgi:hypothetical protein